jgi:hypothetical protein
MKTPTNASWKRILIVSGSTFAVLCTLIAALAFGMFGKGSSATHAAGISGHATVPLSFKNPNGQHPGDCGTIEFFLENMGNGTVEAQEYVDTFLPGASLESVDYSTVVVNQVHMQGQTFGTLIIPKTGATSWDNVDKANNIGVAGDTIHGTFQAMTFLSAPGDPVLDHQECIGNEADTIKL